MAVASTVVLDLDDTLYLERDYVRSGFLAVAASLASHESRKQYIFDVLWDSFCNEEPLPPFQHLTAIDAHLSTADIPQLVKVYREHTPSITLLPGARAFLDWAMEAQLNLALITDGDSDRQRAKLRSLGIESCFQSLIVTGDRGRTFWKPHPWSYLETAGRLSIEHGPSLAYVGDNAEKDFLTPNQLGWTTLQIRQPGQLRDKSHDSQEHQANYQVDNWDRVRALLT